MTAKQRFDSCMEMAGLFIVYAMALVWGGARLILRLLDPRWLIVIVLGVLCGAAVFVLAGIIFVVDTVKERGGR
jgi:hypothetical protein